MSAEDQQSYVDVPGCERRAEGATAMRGNSLVALVLVGEAGWYVPSDVVWCPRCGDQNWTDERICITCTDGDDDYRDGLFRNGWSPPAPSNGHRG